MQDELRSEFPFNVRVGINSGTVTAGMLGPKDKSLYDVLGDGSEFLVVEQFQSGTPEIVLWSGWAAPK